MTQNLRRYLIWLLASLFIIITACDKPENTNLDPELIPRSESAWKVFNQNNTGLPEWTLDYVFSIAVDDLDRVWAGLDNGLFYRLDSNEWSGWQCYNGASEVMSVDLDSQGNAWITGGDLGKWNGGDVQEFYARCPTYNTCIYPRSIAIDEQDNIWTGYYDQSGPSRFDGVEWIDYDTLGLPEVIDIAIDNSGNIWYTADSALVHYDHETWTVHNGPTPIWHNSLEIDNQNRIWVICENNHLAVFDGASWTELEGPYYKEDEHYDDPPKDANEPPFYPYLNDLVIDNNGVLFGAFDDGLLAMDISSGIQGGIAYQGTLLTNENSPLPDGFVTCLTFDKHGNLWGGTHAYGASGPGGGGIFKVNLSGN